MDKKLTDNPYQAPADCGGQFGPSKNPATGKIRGGPPGDSQFLIKSLIFGFLLLAVLLGIAPFFMYISFMF